MQRPKKNIGTRFTLEKNTIDYLDAIIDDRFSQFRLIEAIAKIEYLI